MKRRTQLQMKQLGAITAAWLAVGLLITVYDQLGMTAAYSFKKALAIHTVAALMGSLLGGSLLVFYVNVKYVDKPYWYTIAVVAVSYMAVMITIFMMLGLIVPTPILDPSHIKSTLVWSIVVAITQLLLQINSKFGQGAFGNIIRGKYNTPKEENRIFMFLDMNSSTTIAEQGQELFLGALG